MVYNNFYTFQSRHTFGSDYYALSQDTSVIPYTRLPVSIRNIRNIRSDIRNVCNIRNIRNTRNIRDYCPEHLLTYILLLCTFLPFSFL